MARYLGKTFWPVSLANPYPLPAHWPVLPALLAFALFAGLCVAAVGFRQRFPFALTGWFWFAGMLVPVIGLVQVGNAAMADRYTYLPLIGVFIILVWGVGDGRRATGVCRGRSSPSLPLLLLLAAAGRTRDQIGCWQNSGTLFTHALAVTENNYVAENNLGTWLSKNGQIADAMDCFRRSLQIQPDNPDALFNLGNAFARLGNWDEAITNYQRAIQIAPDQAGYPGQSGLCARGEETIRRSHRGFRGGPEIGPGFRRRPQRPRLRFVHPAPFRRSGFALSRGIAAHAR